eukprot:scaffold219561_cov18-Tisochrysis_lutea.AAC.1
MHTRQGFAWQLSIFLAGTTAAFFNLCPAYHQTQGLGTSTREEAREYFAALNQHRKRFVWGGEEMC